MDPQPTALRLAVISQRIDDDLMKRFISKANQGFTLIELMAAVVVASLFTAVTAPVLSQNAERNAAA